jgi:3-mercaptopyruvate sulfurtransferase SseA
LNEEEVSAMRERIGRTGWETILLLLVLLPVVAQHGCSLKAYDDAPASVLVSPATLNAWVTQGYGTDSLGYNKLVVLDVSASTGTNGYRTLGHVPGAFQVDPSTEVNVSRSDGLGGTYSYSYWDTASASTVTVTDINAPAQVATSDMMNAVLRRTGIDRNTVVALTGDTLMNVSLAYFNFRYWGFPRERLRVLDRTKRAYRTAGYSLTTAVPPVAPSTYGVCDLRQNTHLRATLADMMDVARGAVPDGRAWDVRAANEYNGDPGATPGPFSGKSGYTKMVAFEGHIQGAVNLNYTGLLAPDVEFTPPDTVTTTSNSILQDATYITTTLRDRAGITPDIRTHIY